MILSKYFNYTFTTDSRLTDLMLSTKTGPISAAESESLTQFTKSTRSSLCERGVTGPDGAQQAGDYTFGAKYFPAKMPRVLTPG